MELELIAKTGAFLLLLLYGTHIIRTWAFSRYEAVTYECSAGALLLSLLLIVRYGACPQFVFLSIVLLLGFIGNAFSQWHFYMVLQEQIGKAFAEKESYFRTQENGPYLSGTLKTMASVAIMPSFSRFIEESKIFNNPGSFIGLIKSIMKRQRFQKKKYQMRECFAENVNLIGPCKPAIDNMMYDEVHTVPGAIHANDLALDYRDEKKGLFSFDVLGFGALALIWYYLVINRSTPLAGAAPIRSDGAEGCLMLVVILAFTLLSHILRHFAFARYESVSYELSFAALVAVAFEVFENAMSGIGSTRQEWIFFWIVTGLFFLASFFNHRTDKRLHDRIDEKFRLLISRIPPISETNRMKRKFLQNLQVISKWTIVPFPGTGRKSDRFMKLMVTEKLREFETTNRMKQEMALRMERLVDKIVPEEKAFFSESDFQVPEGELRMTRWILNIAGWLSVILVFVCTCNGVL